MKKIILTIVLLLAVGTLVFWYFENRSNDSDVSENTVLSTTVYNQTKSADAVTVTANPNDVIVYTLTVSNTSEDVIPGYVVETNIGDLSELANLTDAAGANYNANTNSLMWTPLDIPAEGSITKEFTVRVKENLPAGSDLLMTLSFNNEVAVAVAPAQVAGNANPTPTPNPTPGPSPSYAAPTTGPSLWFAILLGLVFTVGLLLYRTARRMNA